jgi:zinc protease
MKIMIKKLSTLLLVTTVALTVNAQTKKPVATKVQPKTNQLSLLVGAELIETVEPKAGQLVIPYKKFKLKNGLTIMVNEDHSDPVVYVDVTYHVGSAREQQGRSGLLISLNT